jgi:hypothetical protein
MIVLVDLAENSTNDSPFKIVRSGDFQLIPPVFKLILMGALQSFAASSLNHLEYEIM